MAATGPFGARVLAGLAARRGIAFCLTRVDRPRGRGQRLAPPPAKETAEGLGVPVRQLDRLTPDTELPAETIVVADYGLLIPTALLDRHLWLNVHPSLLPRWRGAAPVERAIMAGDRETGITIHRTTADLDAGPIAAQRSFAIAGEDAGAVYERAAGLAVDLLDGVLDGTSFQAQSEAGATYASKLTPADRVLDWARPPEESLNRIRALSPSVGARGEAEGRRVTVWKARLRQADSVLVADGLELLEVQPEGRRRMSGADFLRGTRK